MPHDYIVWHNELQAPVITSKKQLSQACAVGNNIPDNLLPRDGY
jgi:hypothetical protein